MKIVKYLLGSRNVIIGRIEFQVLWNQDNYYLVTDGKDIFILDEEYLNSKRDISPDTSFIYRKEGDELEKEDTSRIDSVRYQDFLELYDKTMDSLKHQISLISSGLDAIKSYEKKIEDQKKSIEKANAYTLKCMNALSDMVKLLKEDRNEREKNNRKDI